MASRKAELLKAGKPEGQKARIQVDRIPGEDDMVYVKFGFSFAATEVMKWQRIAELLALVLTDEEKDELIQKFETVAAEVRDREARRR